MFLFMSFDFVGLFCHGRVGLLFTWYFNTFYELKNTEFSDLFSNYFRNVHYFFRVGLLLLITNTDVFLAFKSVLKHVGTSSVALIVYRQ